MLLRHRLGPHWLRHPVVLLVLASAVYQGVSPLLLAIPSVGAWNIYRNGIQQSFIDSATLLTSAGLLALTDDYLLTHPECADVPPAQNDAATAARVLDWRLLALACTPLAVLTYEGRCRVCRLRGPGGAPQPFHPVPPCPTGVRVRLRQSPDVSMW